MAYYILVRLKVNATGIESDYYQEIDEEGNLVCIKDLDGNVVELGETSGYVVNENCPRPAWAPAINPSEGDSSSQPN